jgi:prevent-host-death family protein
VLLFVYFVRIVYYRQIQILVGAVSRIAASDARVQFAEVVNKVAFGGERIVLHRHGKDVAAIVPVEDLELLQKLEDRMDLEAARAALNEKSPRVSWKKLKAGLGLD